MSESGRYFQNIADLNDPDEPPAGKICGLRVYTRAITEDGQPAATLGEVYTTVSAAEVQFLDVNGDVLAWINEPPVLEVGPIVFGPDEITNVPLILAGVRTAIFARLEVVYVMASGDCVYPDGHEAPRLGSHQ